MSNINSNRISGQRHWRKMEIIAIAGTVSMRKKKHERLARARNISRVNNSRFVRAIDQ